MGHDLAAPQRRGDELKQVGREFFQGREIDGKEGLWHGDQHGARLRRHHHGR